MKLPFPGRLCARTALSLSCGQGSGEGARDVSYSLINGREAGSAAARRSAPIGCFPPHGTRGARGGMHVLSEDILVIGQRGTAAPPALKIQHDSGRIKKKSDVFTFEVDFPPSLMQRLKGEMQG